MNLRTKEQCNDDDDDDINQMINMKLYVILNQKLN